MKKKLKKLKLKKKKALKKLKRKAQAALKKGSRVSISRGHRRHHGEREASTPNCTMCLCPTLYSCSGE